MTQIIHGEFSWGGSFLSDRILPPKGTWFNLPIANGKNQVAIVCTNCGKPYGIWNHLIDATGTVKPSVICGYKCGFHDMIQLIGYSP